MSETPHQPFLPIEQVADLEGYRRPVQDNPLAAFNRLEMHTGVDIATAASRDTAEAVSSWPNDIAASIALGEHLYVYLQATGELPARPQGRITLGQTARSTTAFNEGAINALADVYKTSPQSIIQHSFDRLNRWHDWLAGTSLATEPSFNSPYAAMDHADILGMALTVLPGGTPEANEQYNQTIARLSELFLRHNKIGLATAFAVLQHSPTWSSQFVSQLIEVLNAARGRLTEGAWREQYAQVAGTLRGKDARGSSMLREFVRQVPRGSLARIPGSAILLDTGQRINELELHYPSVQTEHYTVQDALACTLADGSVAHLPFVTYCTRAVRKFGLPEETVGHGEQVLVDFDILERVEQAAVERVLRPRPGIEMHRPLARLVRRGSDGALRVVSPRPDVRNLAYINPKAIGVLPATLDGHAARVSGLRAVGDALAHMVVPYNPEFSRGAVYTSDMPGRLAPPNANAYWVAGLPRHVIGRIGSELMYSPEGGGEPEPRFTILPVKYFNVIEA